MSPTPTVLDVAPSLRHPVDIRVVDHDDPLDGVEAVSVPVTTTDAVPDVLGARGRRRR
jgi:hypothetical protein